MIDDSISLKVLRNSFFQPKNNKVGKRLRFFQVTN